VPIVWNSMTGPIATVPLKRRARRTPRRSRFGRATHEIHYPAGRGAFPTLKRGGAANLAALIVDKYPEDVDKHEAREVS
jgi:hypothetical protein